MSTPGCDLLQLIGLDMQYARWRPSNNNNNNSNRQNPETQTTRRNGIQRNTSQHNFLPNLANSSHKLSQSNPNLKWNSCSQTTLTRSQNNQSRRRESSPWPLMGDESTDKEKTTSSSTSSLSSSDVQGGVVSTVGSGDRHQRSHSASSCDVTHSTNLHRTSSAGRGITNQITSSSQGRDNKHQKQGYQRQYPQHQHQYNNNQQHQAYRRNGYVSNTYQNGHHQQHQQNHGYHNNHHHNQPGHQGSMGVRRQNHQNRYYNTFLPNNCTTNFNGGGLMAINSNSGAQKRYQNGRHYQMPVATRCRRTPSSPFFNETSMFPLTNDPRFIELMNAGTPPDKFLAKANQVQITKPPQQLTNGSMWDELSKAVWNKFLTNQQTKVTYEKKLTLWKCLYVYLKIVYPRYSLFMVGSTMSGFGSNTSDVDMCLMVGQTEVDDRREALHHLTHLMEHFNSYEYFVNIELIHAKVPILKFKSKNDALDIDLSCNNTVGVRNTHLLYCYAKHDWRVRPLVLVVKLWAQWHDINDAKNTTVSSYSLALMVIHFLQCGVRPAVLPCLQQSHAACFSPHADLAHIDFHSELPGNKMAPVNCQPIGQLLLEFFNYYNTFDYRQYAISVRQGACLLIDDCRKVRTAKNEPHQWKYLCIEEPFDLTNTARSVNNLESFERIRHVIRQTAAILNNTGSLEAIFRFDSWTSHC